MKASSLVACKLHWLVVHNDLHLSDRLQMYISLLFLTVQGFVM